MPSCLFRRARRGDAGDEMDEKRSPKPRRWLIFLIILNRIWQCVYAMVVYASAMYLVLNEKSGLVALQKRTRVIEGLGYAVIFYHANVLLLTCLLRKNRKETRGRRLLCLRRRKQQETRGRRFFSVATLVGDASMMGLTICKMSAMRSMGVLVSCHRQENIGYFRGMLKNAAAFARNSLGWDDAGHVHDIDLTCWIPKAIYVLCMMAIVSYMLSVLLTGLHLHKNWDKTVKRDVHPGHVEEAIPEMVEQEVGFTGPDPAPAASSEEPPPRYANIADVATPSPGRSSQDTISTFDPDLYLVSDGFRPAAGLPAYSSRPPSYKSRPPSYASRPSCEQDA